LYANWAIQILPYIEEQPLYDSFVLFHETLPGGSGPSLAKLNDGPNRIPRGTEVQYMLCPSDSGKEQKFGDSIPPLNGGNWARGNYAFNAGLGYVGDMMSPGTEDDPWGRPCGRGVGGYNRGAKMTQIEDGTTKTIMLGEIRIGLSGKDRRGVWAMPMVGSNVLAEQASNYALGPNDCSPGTDDLAITQAAIDEVGEANYISECMLPSAYRQSVSSVVRSKHPGGVHVALCDGSVRFVSDNIHSGVGSAGYQNACEAGTMNDFGVWQRINSSNDGFVFEDSGF
jgi:prepilin-type processing-associated H-X9-DG protein